MNEDLHNKLSDLRIRHQQIQRNIYNLEQTLPDPDNHPQYRDAVSSLARTSREIEKLENLLYGRG